MMKRHTRALVDALRENLPAPPTAGAEIGVWQGENAAGLLREFPDLRLWMIDAWRQRGAGGGHRLDSRPQSDFEDAMCRAAEATSFAKHRRYLVRELSADAAPWFAGQFDFVFLDADHRRESVAEDIRLWLPKVRAGGVLAGHDYAVKAGRGVVEAVDEAFGGRVRFNKRAVTWWVVV